MKATLPKSATRRSGIIVRMKNDENTSAAATQAAITIHMLIAFPHEASRNRSGRPPTRRTAATSERAIRSRSHVVGACRASETFMGKSVEPKYGGGGNRTRARFQ